MIKYIDYILTNSKEIATIITVTTGVVVAILGILSYRIKAKAEISLIKKNEAEIDIKLIKQFSELITIANARGGYLLSENAVEKYFEKNTNFQINKEELAKINQDLEDLAILTLPVGLASQNATAVALTDFALKNTLLLNATKLALEQLPLIPNIKKDCLNRIND